MTTNQQPSESIDDNQAPLNDKNGGQNKKTPHVLMILDGFGHREEDKDNAIAAANMPNLDKITLIQLDGVLTPDEYKKCVETAIDGCKQVYEIQKKALTDKFFANGGDQ